VGRLEAFATAGGLSTMSRTWQGRLRTLKNKTLRYPGHAAMMRTLTDVGLLSLDPVDVNGVPVVPRALLHRLLEPRFAPTPEDRDLMVIHVVARGERDGAEHTVRVHLLDLHDESTGFSAMERTTGFHLAIVASMLARGEIAPGAAPLEVAVPAPSIVRELAKRGMHVDTRIEREGAASR
jgi:lysine 6-dehydrogenase